MDVALQLFDVRNADVLVRRGGRQDLHDAHRSHAAALAVIQLRLLVGQRPGHQVVKIVAIRVLFEQVHHRLELL